MAMNVPNSWKTDGFSIKSPDLHIRATGQCEPIPSVFRIYESWLYKFRMTPSTRNWPVWKPLPTRCNTHTGKARTYSHVPGGMRTRATQCSTRIRPCGACDRLQEGLCCIKSIYVTLDGDKVTTSCTRYKWHEGCMSYLPWRRKSTGTPALVDGGITDGRQETSGLHSGPVDPF
jgi:hypothetical protein